MSGLAFGPFELEQRIAVGGSSEVYLARASGRPDLPARFVVKRLLPQLRNDLAFRAMVAREAKLQAQITHPNVVRVLLAGSLPNGEPYVAVEYVDGVDGDKLTRRMRQEPMRLASEVSVHIACEVLLALAAVHGACDDHEIPLHIVHRDVTPSNIYFARNGAVKLGDFGLAFSQQRASLRSETGNMLKGKFAYLAPEQVAGEAFDQRADLFSAAVVLSELLLGKPLFSGASQLAVLLAIRDGRTFAVRELEGSVDPGLLLALERALSRDAGARFPNADAFREALLPFAESKAKATTLLAQKVAWVQTHPTATSFRSISTSQAAAAMAAQSGGDANGQATAGQDSEDDLMLALEQTELAGNRPAGKVGRTRVTTARFAETPSFAETARGEHLGPLSFAELVEALATGRIERGDNVDYMGRGHALVENYAELERFLPTVTAVTIEMTGLGAPDFQEELTAETTLELLARVLRGRETGVLFAEHLSPGASASNKTPAAGPAGRKDLYFEDGLLMHVASSDGSELLGEYLVRRGELERDELNLALAVLPRYNGRMGDTLIALGLVGPMNVFRAIREQGRDRVADLFRWEGGKLAFYRGATRPHIDFPLKLALPALLLAGLEAQPPTQGLVAGHKAILDRKIARETGSLADGQDWPTVLGQTLALATRTDTLRGMLTIATATEAASSGDVIRALYILLATRKLRWA